MEQDLPELDIAALNPPLNVQLVTSSTQLSEVKDFLDEATVFGYDIETNIADSFTSRIIRTLQVGDRSKQFVIDLLALAGSTDDLMMMCNRTAPVWAQSLTNALCGPLMDGTKVKVGHNLSFEYETIRWCLGLRACNFYDTMLAEKVIRCGELSLFQAGNYGLKDLVARYYKKKLAKEEQKGFDLVKDLTDAQITYGAVDIRVPLGLRDIQAKFIAKDGLARAVQVQMDAIPAFSEMKVSGMLLDQDAWNRIVESNVAQHRSNVAELDRYFIPMYGTKENPNDQIGEEELAAIEARWRDEGDKTLRAQFRKAYQEASKKYKERVKDKDLWEGEAALNYGSDDQILKALQKYGAMHGEKFATIPATNEKILSKYETNPVIAAVLSYRKTSKVLSTYGTTFLTYVDAHSGRVHPNINLFGAETGRTSATRPNSQNIPPDQRKCFVARPGYVLITADMSGAELRIMAELADYGAWIEMFAKGWDVHSVGAEMIYGKGWKDAADADCAYYRAHEKCGCKKHKVMRDAVKAVNFGVAYGMEKYALASRLKIDPKEADSLLRKWREVNEPLANYLRQSAQRARETLVARTLSGFRRRFMRPDYERSREVAAERHKKDGKDGTPHPNDATKVYNGAWGSVEREGKNTPIQGGNADVAKVAMGAGYDKEGKPFMWHLLPQYGAELINFVHDEFVVECPEEHQKECERMVGDCIRRAGAEFMSKVVMEYESNISYRWEK